LFSADICCGVKIKMGTSFLQSLEDS